MSGFVLDRVPQIKGGAGILDTIGEAAAPLAGGRRRALLVADAGLAAAGLISKVEGALARVGFEVVTFSAFKSDPTTAQTDAACKAARENDVGVVVALGGGSAMDLGKAVAAITPADAPTVHYGLCANPFPAKPLPKICVPTTSGTGSETTRTSVLTNDEGAKLWFWGDELKADLVVLDPETTVGLPAHLTAATGIDAFVHAMEAATNRNAFAANDVYCHEAIRLVARYLVRAVEKPNDLEARGGMQLAAAFAGIGIDNAGTAIGHNIGHAIASLIPIHHGRAVGLAVLATLHWNIEGETGEFTRVADALGVKGGAVALPVAYEDLLRRVNMRIDLSEEANGLTPERLAAQMARPENEAMRRSNRRAVGDDDLLTFARTMLSQK